MNQQETLAWVLDLLPGEPTVTSRQVGPSFPAVTVAELSVESDATPSRPETVAMTLNASQLDPQLETEDGSDLRVEFITITSGHTDTAGELLAAAFAMIAEDPRVRTPQPGTFLPHLGAHVDPTITAKHGLLLAPFVWAEGVPHVHEVTSGGKRSKDKSDKEFEFTHPGRLTVPAQLVMLNDEEYRIALTEGLNAVQDHIAAQGIDLNDVWRVPAEL
ncbi:hypothetical protein [Corynebacterium urogenitale]